MLKTFKILVLFMGLSGSLMAQQDAKATEILNGVSAKYKTYTTVKAAFSLKVENSLDQVKDNQTGTLYTSAKKFKVELTNQDIVCNGTTIWTCSKEAGKITEVTVDDYEPDENAITPSQIFTIWEKNFKYLFVEEKTENGKVVQVIDLTPNDSKKNYFKVRITIDKVNKSIISAKIFDKNGNKYTYTVTVFTANPVLADSFFNFDATKYPNVTVTDNRE